MLPSIAKPGYATTSTRHCQKNIHTSVHVTTLLLSISCSIHVEPQSATNSVYGLIGWDKSSALSGHWTISIRIHEHNCACYLRTAEFTLLNKDGTSLGDQFDVEQPMSLQEPLALLRNSPFLMKVYDVMETLGWEPYQV
jgi:hypothetical protein